METRIISYDSISALIEAGNKVYEIIISGGSVNVCNRNASNRAWNNGKLGGTWFSSFEEAENSYKSANAKAAIRTAKELLE